MNTDDPAVFREVKISFDAVRSSLPGELKCSERVLRSIQGRSTVRDDELPVSRATGCSHDKQNGIPYAFLPKDLAPVRGQLGCWHPYCWFHVGFPFRRSDGMRELQCTCRRSATQFQIAK
jgi:hypothetical protein